MPAGRTGAYLILVHLKKEQTLRIGRLGRILFARGNYAYVGSAMAGLEARVARHLRKQKRVKWHIDFLLRKAEVLGAALFPSKRRNECALARSVLNFRGALAVPGFGCSDCRCTGHLFFLGDTPFGKLLRELDRKGGEAR